MSEPEGKALIALHGIIPRTTTNGPGTRFGIWVQGCSRHCPGCFNPKMIPGLTDDAGEFKAPNTPGWIEVEALYEMIINEHAREAIEGLSFSGGEPFDQAGPLHDLIGRTRSAGLSVLIFTGYTLEELLARKETEVFIKPEPLVDVLIDGPFDGTQLVEGELRGSANQNIRILTGRYTEKDLVPPGPLECIIQPDGSVAMTGFTRGPFGE